MEGDKRGKNQKLMLQILVPIFIAAVVAGIWFVKQAEKTRDIPAPSNPDFALNATGAFELDRLKSYGLPILLEFGNDFCGPCWEMKPIIEKLNRDLQGRAIIKYIDTYQYAELADRFPISGLPSQVFYDAAGHAYSPANPNHPWMTLYRPEDPAKPSFTIHKGTITEAELLDILYAMGMK